MKIFTLIDSLSDEDPALAKEIFKQHLNESSSPYPTFNEIVSDVHGFVDTNNCPVGNSVPECDDFAIALEYAYYGLTSNTRLQRQLRDAYAKAYKHALKQEQNEEEVDFLRVFFDHVDEVLHTHKVYEEDPSYLRKTKGDTW